MNKKHYISVNILSYLFGTELLQVTLYDARKTVEPMLRNLVFVYMYKYLLQEAPGLHL